MVLVQSIHAENYYSIGDITYNIGNGVLKLSGHNGSGKTSFCSILCQGLYNKSLKNEGTGIEDTYNKVTSKPYKITVELLKDDVQFTIINDRAKNNIFIFRKGNDITPKGIKNQLLMIQSIIGLDYETFKSLTYLNQSSMETVFELEDTNNILHKFFDLALINFLEKNLKLERRDLSKQVNFISSQIEDIERTIVSLEKYTLIDIAPMYSEKQAKSNRLTEVMSDGTVGKISVVRGLMDKKRDIYEASKEPVIALTTEANMISRQLKELQSGKCPVCGSTVTETLESYSNSLQTIQSNLEIAKETTSTLKEEFDSLTKTYNTLNSEYTTLVETLQREITSVDNRITVAEEKNKGYLNIKDDIDKFKQKLVVLDESRKGVSDTLTFIEAALGVISSGSITKQYVKSFLYTLNNKLSNLCKQSDIEFNIVVNEVEGKIVYAISNANDNTITFENLSSGERTRVSLIVLLAIVGTLEILTNVSINIMMFDEILSLLDKKGIDIFTELLGNYRENKSTFVIQHHNEIPDKFFDNVIRVQKVNNLTEIIVES